MSIDTAFYIIKKSFQHGYWLAIPGLENQTLLSVALDELVHAIHPVLRSVEGSGQESVVRMPEASGGGVPSID